MSPSVIHSISIARESRQAAAETKKTVKILRLNDTLTTAVAHSFILISERMANESYNNAYFV